MKISIYQKVKLYRKDAIRYFISEVFDRPFLIALLIYMVIAILYFLNKALYIYFFPLTIELLTFSLGIGFLGMIVYSIFWLIEGIRKINKDSFLLYEGKLDITIDNNDITIQMEKNNKCIKTNWNKIKKLIVLNDTAYFIPLEKKDFMIKINKKEIIDGNFQKMVEFAASIIK